MAERVTTWSKRESERLYEAVKVDLEVGRGYKQSQIIGYRDVDTGLLVSDVEAFEKWIGRRTDGAD